MTVKELIDKLIWLDGSKEVFYYDRSAWDGEGGESSVTEVRESTDGIMLY